MKFATQLSTFVSDIQHETNTEKKIREWVNSNMLFVDQRYVWEIGVTTGENILLVESQIRQDLQCKHWKYWHTENFHNAMELIRKFNQSPHIFKSKLNEYIGKGAYIFIYKTAIHTNEYYHSLRGL